MSNTRGVGFDVLAKMRRKIGDIGKSRFKEECGQVLAGTALKLIADGFRSERDPYGKSWPPLKHRNGKILRDTGRLANSYIATPTGDGLRIRTNVHYAAIHQYGATVKEHKRDSSILYRSAKTRKFVSSKRALKKGGLLRKNIAAYMLPSRTQGEFTIPQRQMVPMEETGGVGPIWGRAFRRDANKFIRAWLEQK